MTETPTLTKAAIDAVLKDLDGWTIWLPSKFLDAGFPPEFVATITRKHTSDGTPKGTIDEDPNKSVVGCYSLDMLYAIAGVIHADQKEAHSKIGRGFQAWALHAAIRARLDTAAIDAFEIASGWLTRPKTTRRNERNRVRPTDRRTH